MESNVKNLYSSEVTSKIKLKVEGARAPVPHSYIYSDANGNTLYAAYVAYQCS